MWGLEQDGRWVEPPGSGSVMGICMGSLAGWGLSRRVSSRTGSHSHLECGEMEQAIHAGQQGCEDKPARGWYMVPGMRTRAGLLLGIFTAPQGGRAQ